MRASPVLVHCRGAPWAGPAGWGGGSDAVRDRGRLSAGLRDLFLDVAEGRVIDDVRDGVANLLHHQPGPAALFVHAFGAANVGFLADAGDRGQRPIDDADHLTDEDPLGRAGEGVAAPLSLLALQDPAILE